MKQLLPLLLILILPFSLAIDYCVTLDSKGEGWGYSYDNTYGHAPVDLSQTYIGHDADYLYLKWVWMGKATCSSRVNAYIDLDPAGEKTTLAEYTLNWLPEECVGKAELYMNANAIYDENTKEILGPLQYDYIPSEQTGSSDGKSTVGGYLEVKIPRKQFNLKDRTGITMQSTATSLYGGDQGAYNDYLDPVIYDYSCGEFAEVPSIDSFGDIPVSSNPPIISNVTYDSDKMELVVDWVTDKPTTGTLVVEDKNGEQYTSTTQLNTNHQASITLKKSAKKFTITARDSYGLTGSYVKEIKCGCSAWILYLLAIIFFLVGGYILFKDKIGKINTGGREPRYRYRRR